MILGTGIDIVEIARVEKSYEQFGQRFVERILKEAEIEYCFAHTNPFPHIAARFAAKEAASKAFQTGIGEELRWHDMEITKLESGAPRLIFHGKGLKLIEKRKVAASHLSLSHAEHYATAVVILEGREVEA